MYLSDIFFDFLVCYCQFDIEYLLHLGIHKSHSVFLQGTYSFQLHIISATFHELF